MWLTFPNLLNFPSRDDACADRDLSLPLTYDGEGRQHRGPLVPDGVVRNVIDLGLPGRGGGGGGEDGPAAPPAFGLFPFYGHVLARLRRESGRRPTASFAYDWRRSVDDLSEEFEAFCDEKFPGRPVQVLAHSMGGLIAFAAMRRRPEKFAPGGVFAGVPFGTGTQYLQDLHRGYYTELDRCRQFLPAAQMSFSSHACFFPVDAEEAADLLVDVTAREKDGGVDFVADTSAIGKPSTEFRPTVEGDAVDMDYYDPDEWERLEMGVFDPTLELDAETKKAYKNHLRLSMEKGRRFRETALRPYGGEAETLPPLTVCATDKFATVNQILRRKKKPLPISINTSNSKKVRNTVTRVLSKIPRGKKITPAGPTPPGRARHEKNAWEYDYVSGRSVPGDGRIDYAKAFPPAGVPCREVALDSAHAKQFCWEDRGGGSLGKIWAELEEQRAAYARRRSGRWGGSGATLVLAEEDASGVTAVEG